MKTRVCTSQLEMQRQRVSRCLLECACNLQDKDLFELAAEEAQLLRMVQCAIKLTSGKQSNMQRTYGVRIATAVVNDVINLANACTTPAARMRVAHLLSVPMFCTGGRHAKTLTYMGVTRGFICKSQLLRLLNIVGPCLRLGKAATGWPASELVLPELRRLVEVKTILDGLLEVGRNRCEATIALRHAGGLPRFPLRGWRRQWRAWHGRRGRRLWLMM